MQQIGFAYYSSRSDVRGNLYLTSNNKAFCCLWGHEYFFDLDISQLLRIQQGYHLHVTLSRQTLLQIREQGIMLTPIFTFTK